MDLPSWKFQPQIKLIATNVLTLPPSGIYENESRTGEMLSAACAIGVASTFYSPIGKPKITDH